MSSYAFFYYGADAIPSVENAIDTFADGLLTTDAEIERIIGPLKSTDLMGATVRGIGGYLRLVHSAESLSAMPQYLGDLLRRAA
jgi:hypothetical protein